MALNALASCATYGMTVVLLRVIGGRQMALAADGVALGDKMIADEVEVSVDLSVKKSKKFALK